MTKYLPANFNGNESFIKSCICMTEFLCTLTHLHLFQLVFTYSCDVPIPKPHQIQPKHSLRISILMLLLPPPHLFIFYSILCPWWALECGGSAFWVQPVPPLILKFNNNHSIEPGGSIGGVLNRSNSSYNLFRLGKALSP